MKVRLAAANAAAGQGVIEEAVALIGPVVASAREQVENGRLGITAASPDRSADTVLTHIRGQIQTTLEIHRRHAGSSRPAVTISSATGR